MVLMVTEEKFSSEDTSKFTFEQFWKPIMVEATRAILASPRRESLVISIEPPGVRVLSGLQWSNLRQNETKVEVS
jgi:hypothetical protein